MKDQILFVLKSTAKLVYQIINAHTFKTGNTRIINGQYEYSAAINSENPVITQ